VEYGPERQDDDQDDEAAASRPDPSGPPSSPPTGGVRIIGAETAADITSELPIVPPAHISPEASPVASVRIIDESGTPDAPVPVDEVPPTPPAAPTELPHWTEPATGQVPAVLVRDDGDGAGAGILPPTWREEDADWTAHEEVFDPSMFSDDRTALGALDETRDTDQERRPWEFDLDSVRPGQPGPGATAPAHSSLDPITEPVEIVSSSEPSPERTVSPTPEPPYSGDATSVISLADIAAAGSAASASGAPSDAVDPGVIDTAADEQVRPSGTPRVGRARRGGLLPARLKAKRPDEDVAPTGEPLAAEPPGASVTDVPGAGRRKPGLAGLAAADRAADEDQSHEPAPAPVPSAAAPEETAEAAPTRRRSRRRSEAPDRPLRSSGNYTPEVTGGTPPEPRAARSRARDADQATGSTGMRIGTGVAVAVVALLAFKIGTVTALILCLLVVTFAAGEAFAVLKRSGWRPATLLGLVGTISLMVGAYNKGIAALPLVLVLMTAFTLLWYLFGVERGSAVAGTASTMLVIGWVALLGSFAGLLLAPSLFPDRHGIAFLLGAIIATVANDVGALVVGRWIGSRQLAPNVSPNKTWEGLAGGALASILVSTVVVGAIHPWSPANAALLGVVVAVVAPLGDLCESLLKRDLRLKDMGTLLPGHGGVLDRVDALLFVLPATYYLVRALNIG
jgi:phosphatidate cytidylyltransferase